MLLKFFSLWCFLCSNICLAQAQAGDHLQPAEDYFASTSAEHKALCKLRQLLYTGLSERPLARVVLLPPTSAGYVLSLDHDSIAYRLTYRVGQRAIWYMLNPKSEQDMAVETKTVEVRQEVAVILVKLLTTAVSQTAYPKITIHSADTGHLIIAAYQPGIGLRSGRTSAVGNGSNMTALASVVEHTRELAINPTDQSTQKTLLQEATQLLEQLKN